MKTALEMTQEDERERDARAEAEAYRLRVNRELAKLGESPFTDEELEECLSALFDQERIVASQVRPKGEPAEPASSARGCLYHDDTPSLFCAACRVGASGRAYGEEAP